MQSRTSISKRDKRVVWSTRVCLSIIRSFHHTAGLISLFAFFLSRVCVRKNTTALLFTSCYITTVQTKHAQSNTPFIHSSMPVERYLWGLARWHTYTVDIKSLKSVRFLWSKKKMKVSYGMLTFFKLLCQIIRGANEIKKS